MRFARLGRPGDEVPVLLDGDRAFELRPLIAELVGIPHDPAARLDLDGAFLAAGGLRAARDAHAAGRLPELDRAGLRVGPPIARPSAVYCIGMNYAAHAAESGAEPPAEPVVFMKAPNTIVGPDDAVAIPRGSAKTDWEVELGLVIGSRTDTLDDPARARDHVAGYVVANDLSERDWQLGRVGGQWTLGKSAPGFCPLGPWLVPADAFDADDARLRSWVNGEPRQDSRTADLIFGIDRIVWELSRFLVLEPGDLVLTGTPEGVALSGRFPYLAPGDVVELEIDGLGRQRQEVIG